PPSIPSTASSPSETQRYLFRKGNKIKNQNSYHSNHLRSLSAADSVSSTSSPESSTYAVKLSYRPEIASYSSQTEFRDLFLVTDVCQKVKEVFEAATRRDASISFAFVKTSILVKLNLKL
ncbi:unnamed protein product, partial [Brassica rapa subsp. trilocularis]